MEKVILLGWRPGFIAVAFIKLLRSSLSMGLAQAKERSDRVLYGRSVELEFSDAASARDFVEEAVKLGVVIKGRNDQETYFPNRKGSQAG